MPVEIKAAIIGAVIGAAVAIAPTWLREWCRERKRRINVASALVGELRIYRQSADYLAAGAKNERVFATQPFSQHLFQTTVSEVASLGPDVFVKVRAAYARCGHIEFLRGRFERRDSVPPQDMTNFPDAFTVSVENARDAIGEALIALRPYATATAFELALPPLKLSAAEEALLRSLANR